MTSDHPFAPAPSPQTFLETQAGAEALRRLDEGLGTREPFLLVTGDPGTGKSMLASQAIARWGSRVTAAYLPYPTLTGQELLEEILRRLGGEPPDGASRPKLVAQIEARLSEIASAGRVAMVVVDDAHRMTLDSLEELRLLVGAARQAGRLFEVLLVGLPELEARLDDPALATLRQRVAVRARLEPLSPGETRSYIRHRVAAAGDDRSNLFPRKTCAEVASLSGGVPRQINALAAEALRLARAAGQPTVEPSHVQAAVSTLSGVLPRGKAEEGAEEPPARAIAPAPARPPAAPPAMAPPANVPEKVSAPAPAPPVPVKFAAPVAPPTPAAAPAPPVPVKSAAPVAPPTPAAAPALAKAPAPPPAAPPVAAPAPAPAPRAPAPAKEPALAKSPAPPKAPAPAPTPASILADDGSTADRPPMPSQDAREWVKRFVGDKGPLQIGSQAMSAASWKPLDDEAEATSGETRAARPAGASAAPPRSRPRTFGLGLAVAGALAAIVIVTAVALILRAAGNARNRAGHVGGDTTTATTPQDADKAPSSRSGSRIGGTSSAGRAGEARPDGSNTTSRGPFSLEVGRGLDLESALDQRERLQALTGFEGWVAPVPGGTGDSYRVVLGVYRSHQRATAAANMLLNSRTLRDVTVVPLPPRSVRR